MIYTVSLIFKDKLKKLLEISHIKYHLHLSCDEINPSTGALPTGKQLRLYYLELEKCVYL